MDLDIDKLKLNIFQFLQQHRFAGLHSHHFIIELLLALTNLHQKHTKNKMRLPWFHCTDSHLFLKDWYGFENLFQYHYYSGTKKVRGPIEIGDHFSYSQDFVRARTWLRSMTNSDLWFSNRIGFVSSYSKLVLRVYIPTFSLALRISSTKTGSSSPSLGLPAYNSWYWN